MQNARARQETSCDENTHGEGEAEGRGEEDGAGTRLAAPCSPTSRPTFRHAFVVSRARGGGGGGGGGGERWEGMDAIFNRRRR